MLGLLDSRTRRAEQAGAEPVKPHALITRYDAERIARGKMMTVEDVLEILAIPLLGVIPESQAVLRASNVGMPVVLDEPSRAGKAYEEAVARLTGEQLEMRIEAENRPGFFQRLFKRTA